MFLVPCSLMRLISWNIRAGGGVRSRAILDQLLRWDADVIGLCEFRGTAPSLALAAALREQGFEHQLTTADPTSPGRNALLLGSKWPLSLLRLRRSPVEPGRWLVASVAAEEPFLIGLMHLPNMVTGRKVTYMESIAALTLRWRRGPAVFLGDTNCGWPGLDDESSVFTAHTAAWLDGLQARGWRDAFRHLYPDGRFYTWYSPNAGNGFRLDQAFVNRAMIHRLRAVRYEWGRPLDAEARRDALSDHAALILDFDVESEDRSLRLEASPEQR
jgi:exonuclease III